MYRRRVRDHLRTCTCVLRATYRSDAPATRQRDPSEEQQPAGDHRGIRRRGHCGSGGHRGPHLYPTLLRPAEEVSPCLYICRTSGMATSAGL